MQKKVISKGWTFYVESWENDADFDRTKTFNTQDEQEKEKVQKILIELYPKVGNMSYDDPRAEKAVKSFLDKYPEITQEDLEDYEFELTGPSEEGWGYRVVDHVTLIHCPEDIYADALLDLSRAELAKVK